MGDAEPRQLLIDQGFLPESRTLFDDVEQSELSCSIEHVMEHRAGGMLRYDVSTAWAIHNPYAMDTDTVRMTTSSTWSGFVIVPKLARRPLAAEAASAKVRAKASASRRSMAAAVAAAPIVPKVALACQPFL